MPLTLESICGIVYVYLYALLELEWSHINSSWTVIGTINSLAALTVLTNWSSTTNVTLNVSSIDCVAHTTASRILRDIVSALGWCARTADSHLDICVIHDALGTSLTSWERN